MQIEVVLEGGAPWGFRLDRSEGKNIVVSRINANSKAHVAGVELGDVVYAVNDTLTSGLTQYDVMKLVQRSRDRLGLLLTRDYSNNMSSTTAKRCNGVINEDKVHSSEAMKQFVLSDINGNSTTTECRPVRESTSRDGQQPMMSAVECGTEYADRLVHQTGGMVAPLNDVPQHSVVEKDDPESHVQYTSSMFDMRSSGVAEFTSRLPTLQNPLIMLLKQKRVQHNSKLGARRIVEDDRTTISERVAVNTSNDEVTAVSDGQWRKPTDNNNSSKTNDNKLSPRTETLNAVNKHHGQSRELGQSRDSDQSRDHGQSRDSDQSRELGLSHENVKKVDDINTVNPNWWTHDVKQSGVEMNGIPTTTKNSLDMKGQREWYKSMFRSLHIVDSKPDSTVGSSFVFAGADPDPRMSIVAMATNKSLNVSNVSIKPSSPSSPDSATDDIDVNPPPFRSRSISSSFSSRPSINNRFRRKSWQVTGGSFREKSSGSNVSDVAAESNASISASVNSAQDKKDLHQTSVTDTASTTASALRQQVTSCARRPSSMIELPEKQSKDWTVLTNDYQTAVEDQNNQASQIPEWARIDRSVSRTQHLAVLSPESFDRNEAGKEQQQVSHKKQRRPEVVQPFGTAIALYPFIAQSQRELSFDRGDTIILLKQIDRNWFEGQCHGQTGVFPASYIEVKEIVDTLSGVSLGEEGIATASYSFVADTHLELSFNKGDTITLIRRIDSNWYEARINGRLGIVPLNYLYVSREPCDVRMTLRNGLDAKDTTYVKRHPNDVSGPRSNNIVTMNGHQTEVTQRKQPMSDYAEGYTSSRSVPVPKVKIVGLDDATKHSTEQQQRQRQRRESRDPIELRHDVRRVSHSHKAPRDDDVVNTNGFQGRGTVDERPRLVTSREAIDQSASEMQQRVMHTATDDERMRQGTGSSDTTAATDHGTVYRSGLLTGKLEQLPRYRAVYNYHRRQPDELDLVLDDVIYVRDMCDDGWFWGLSQRTNRFGSFPGNYVRPL